MESLCRSGSTQESNPVGCSERWAATVAVSFSQTKTVHEVLRKLPRGTKIAVEGHGFMVVVCREGDGPRCMPFDIEPL